MLDLSEITKRALETPRQTVDVEVVFDVGATLELEALREKRQHVIEAIDDLQTDLEAELERLEQDQRASDPRPAAARKTAAAAIEEQQAELDAVDREFDAAEARAAEYLVTFRLTALHGFEWNELCEASLPRSGNASDASVGYNFDEVTRIAASRSGVRVGDDGDTIPITADEWAGVWQALPSPGLNKIKNAVYNLNQYAGLQVQAEAEAAARKVSAAREAATPASPSTSESTPAASPAGNPSKSRTTSTTKTAA